MDWDQYGRAKGDSNTENPISPDELAECTKYAPSKAREICTSFSGPIEKVQLLFEDEVFGNNTLFSSWFDYANAPPTKSIDNCTNTRISRSFSVIE